MEYNFKEIEKKWQQRWADDKVYKTEVDRSRPKLYVLDMFPYPSGAGLHVGHPLGYIASDIYSRFKTLKGFNVLHPMGYDAFGLPAEQYAIQTGQHPAITTEQNIKRYREQMDKIGFSFDWSREIRTCDPKYYHWTQWAFIKMFESYYCYDEQQARPIAELVEAFSQSGTEGLNVACGEEMSFTAEHWNSLCEAGKQETLLNYRMAYRGKTTVNWCPELGTVLANDEVKDGLSERGGYPVEQKLMTQWFLRISAYSQRLLDGLDKIEWSDSLKEIQRNWIGRSEGAQVFFNIKGSDKKLEVFTTRPDTIYGATFMVLAPEHEWVCELTAPDRKEAVNAYLAETKKRSERERITETKRVSGQFIGAYAVNPFNGAEIPIYISDYVLAGYGTGAIMAVPAHDSRDYAFAKHFDLPIIPVVEGGNIEEESYDAKEGKVINSEIINGLDVKDAIRKMFDEVEKRGLGQKRINYRLRDAIFSRQRYWGEPIPIYYKDGIPYPLPLNELPLELPEVSDYNPTPDGEPPLARAANWVTKEGYPIELTTMPGFAGSSAYFLRYMDPHNNTALVDKDVNEYWGNVDLYLGGIEHATGHLIYSRFWNMFLYDIGHATKPEPFQKLINQGMIQGRSNYAYRLIVNRSAEQHTNSRGEKVTLPPISGLNYYVSFNFMNEVKNTQGTFKEKWQILSKGLNEEERKRIIEKLIFLDGSANIQRGLEDGEGYEHYVKNYKWGFQDIHVDINIVKNDVLDLDAFRAWRPEFRDAEFVLEDGKYVCGWAVEKMSKSMFNVVNPDDIIEHYGADTLRMYEMFLGPLEQSKPWDTNGIDGVFKFLRKYWRLFFDKAGNFTVSDEKATPDELKSLHKLIKKVAEDIDNFSFNTSISAFMICVNELTDLKCCKREILEPLTIVLSPFAPHITEEAWHLLGHTASVVKAAYPEFRAEYLVESSVNYPVSFNGKMRFTISLPADMDPKTVEATVLADEQTQKHLDGKPVKKVIVVPKKIVNIVF